METKQDVPDQQQSLNLTPLLWGADQTPQYSHSLMISRDFYRLKCGLKGAILSSCHGEQQDPLIPCLPNYVSDFSLRAGPRPRFRPFSPAVLDTAGGAQTGT